MAKKLSKFNFEVNIFQPGKLFAGMDIGTGFVKVVVLKQTPDGLRLLSIGQARVSKEPVKTGGKLEDPTEEAIKRAVADCKVKLRKVHSNFAKPSLTTRNVLLPQMPQEELRESVKWAVERDLPFPVDEAVFDYLIGPEIIRTGVRNREITVVAAKGEDVQTYAGHFKNAGIKIESLNINAFALWNSFEKGGEWKEDDVIALIDIGAGKSNINIYKGGNLRFNRDLPIAGNALTQGIQQGLNISFEEADDIKIKTGIIENSDIYPVINPILHQFATELERTFDFYKAQSHEAKVNRIVLFGGGANLKGLDKFLSNELGTSVEIGSPLRGIKVDSARFPGIADIAPGLGAAIGLVLTGGTSRRVNLLPREVRKEGKTLLKENLIKIVVVALVLSFGLRFIDVSNKKKQFQKSKKVLDNVIAAWDRKTALENKITFLDNIISKGQVPLEALIGISQKVPEGIWLLDLSISGGVLKLSGEGSSNPLVLEFIKGLGEIPYLKEVTPGIIREKDGAIVFSATCRID